MADSPTAGSFAGTPPPPAFSDTSSSSPQSASQSGSILASNSVSNPAEVAVAQLRWQGLNNLKVGEALDLQLLLETEVAINTLPLAISFDPKVLQIIKISEGDFFKRNGGQSSFSSRIDPSGQIVITANRAGNPPAAAESSGVLLTLNFRALAATAQTQIQLLAASPATTSGRAVSAALPAPHTLQINR